MMAAEHDFLQDPIDLQAPEFGDLYDELPLWSAPFGLMLLDRVPVRAGQTIVDIGAGTGFLALELAQRCGPTSTVYAVDPWAAACARLRRKIALIGLANVRVLEQDAATLELPDGSVDLVVSNLGLNNFENATAVLATCFRLLRPGGRIFLSSNLVGHMAELYAAFRDVIPEDRADELEDHIEHRATVPRMQEQLRAAGFAPGAVTEGSFRLRYADGDALLAHWFIRFGFLPEWLRVAGSPEVIRQLALELNDEAAQKGELALTVPLAVVEATKP
jgi:SAM-dependent methyltransferase